MELPELVPWWLRLPSMPLSYRIAIAIRFVVRRPQVRRSCLGNVCARQLQCGCSVGRENREHEAIVYDIWKRWMGKEWALELNIGGLLHNFLGLPSGAIRGVEGIAYRHRL